MKASTTPELGGNVVVDPRFRARRVAVGREAGHRRLRRLVVLVAVAALALSAAVVLKSPILDVDEISVVGLRATEEAAVVDAVGIGVGSPLLLADLERAEDAVESLPWVEEASVRRSLPGRLEIDVVERTPAAIITAGSTSVLVDAAGQVLTQPEPGSAAPIDLADYVPVLVGDAPPGVGDRVDATLLDAIALADRVRANPVGAVNAIRLDPSVRLELADGGIVEFGDLEAVDAKLEAFRTVYAQVDRTCLGTLDLRVPTHPVLTRADACS